MIREFIHKLKEVSNLKIGIKLLKLWNLEVQFWVSFLKPIGNSEKIERIKKKICYFFKEVRYFL